MSPRVEPERMSQLIAVSAAQYGLFTRAQATACGFGRNAVDYRLLSGSWASVDYGVYCIAGTSITWRRSVLAACLAGQAVASHRSAARLWNVPGFDEAPVEVTAPRHRRRHNPHVVWHETRQLDRDDHTVLERIPATSAVRTALDLAAVVDDDALLHAYDDLARRHLVSKEAIERRLERLGGRRLGVARLRRALALRDDRDPVPESILETRFELALLAADLPQPQRQHEVRDRSGAFVARVDYAFLERRIAVEIDGARHHAGQQDWQRDLRRQNRLVALGWTVLRFTAHDLLDPRAVTDTVRRVLDQPERPSGGVFHPRRVS